MTETLCHLREILTQRLDFLANLMDERQETTKAALELNAKEIKRRLEILNGEAERLRQMQATYLPRELYEINFISLTNIVHEIQRTISNQQGKSQMLSAVISAGISIIVTWLSVAGLKVFH